MIYKIYLRSHAENEQGRIIERVEPTSNPVEAEAAYRRFLRRDDLIGQPVAAVLSRDRKSLYFSRFDLDEQRIHPDAPLDMTATSDKTVAAAGWHPAEFVLPDNPDRNDFLLARNALGLTQKQLAAALGYSAQSRIAEIENGSRNAGPAVLKLLRAYLAGYRPDDWPSSI
ncbi:MAG: hypothetical protein DHS20C08_04500 [Rhodomicrobium sp.]|nr:MAG: hypothetical protein DHS20C08_04500 [Rhodomicrobium sp.]